MGVVHLSAVSVLHEYGYTHRFCMGLGTSTGTGAGMGQGFTILELADVFKN